MERSLLQVLKACCCRRCHTLVISHQVVKVAVLSCEPSKERMLLSFKLLSDSKPEDAGVEKSQKKGRAVNTGQVTGQVMWHWRSTRPRGRKEGWL